MVSNTALYRDVVGLKVGEQGEGSLALACGPAYASPLPLLAGPRPLPRSRGVTGHCKSQVPRCNHRMKQCCFGRGHSRLPESLLLPALGDEEGVMPGHEKACLCQVVDLVWTRIVSHRKLRQLPQTVRKWRH